MSEPSDKDLPDEQQLDEYLKGGSSVSQQYRQLHDADVPPELDGLVLRQARDAVKTVRPAKSRVWMRWTAPLALAASAVLVVSIVIESGVQNDALVTPASAPAPAAHAPMEAQRKSEATDNDASATTVAEGYSEHGFVPEEPRAVAEEQATHPHVPPAEVAVSHEAPPPPVKLDMPSPDESRRERRAPPPPHAIASSRSQAVEADKAAQVLSQQASDRVEQAAAAEQQLMQDVQPPNAGPRNTVSAPRVMPTGAAPIRQKAEETQYSDPELWLRDIRELRIRGKQEEADEEWLRFRVTFPNHVVAESDPARGLK